MLTRGRETALHLWAMVSIRFAWDPTTVLRAHARHDLDIEGRDLRHPTPGKRSHYKLGEKRAQ